ncbi:MAG: hypothetical protein AAF561_14605 [Planctomycetota bacterium]
MSIARTSLILLSLGLFGCAGTPEYVPPYRPFDGRVGYSSAALQPDVHVVSYAGWSGMADGQVIEFARLRAAEVTRANGRTHFRIEEMNLRGRTESSVKRDWITIDRWRHDGSRDFSDSHYVVTDVSVRSVPHVALTVRLLDEAEDGAFPVTDFLGEPPTTAPSTQPSEAE